MYIFKLIFQSISKIPDFLYYFIYDFIGYFWYKKYKIFYGWGIHLFVGKFGQGKTSAMVIRAYKLCKKYPQLHLLTNLEILNFPAHTKILKLKSAEDILNAPRNTLVLVDEIGTLFNSRDFAGGKRAVPKSVFQHLCQCRKRHMMLLATVQRFNLLDKQIRDITATVTECRSSFRHPFTRKIVGLVYSIEEYEAYAANLSYVPLVSDSFVYIQSDKNRHLYDTSELISGLLELEYLSDDEILRNRGVESQFSDYSKEGIKNYKKAVRRRK